MEVHRSLVVLVQFSDFLHVGIREAKVEDVEVLRHTLLVARLGNGHISMCRLEILQVTIEIRGRAATVDEEVGTRDETPTR